MKEKAENTRCTRRHKIIQLKPAVEKGGDKKSAPIPP